jgi:hypothetical protein
MRIRLENTNTRDVLFYGMGKAFGVETVEVAPVPGKHNTTMYINLNGEHVNNTSLGARSVTLTGWVFAESKAQMQSRKRFLNGFFNPRQNVNMYHGEYVLTLTPDVSVRYSAERSENSRRYCKWFAAMTAFDPLWKLQKSQVFFEARPRGAPLFPLIIPKNKGIAFGFTPAVSIENIPNYGDTEVGFVIIYEAAEGQVVNPKVTDNKSGKFIELLITMDQGDIAEVSTVTGGKYARSFRGGAGTDIFKAVSKSSSMDMYLSTGMNDFSVTAALNAANLVTSIRFSPEWLEAQG